MIAMSCVRECRVAEGPRARGLRSWCAVCKPRRMLSSRASRFVVVTALLASIAGCERERAPTPSEVCDWIEGCTGSLQPGCEKSLIPSYEQAADAGCSAELADSFGCLVEQDCSFDGDECIEENEDFQECLGSESF